MIDNNFWDKPGKQAGWISEDIEKLMKEVPCSADFYRYVQWHNLALELTHKMDVPSHTIYYEDYTTAFVETTDALFQFLDLPMVGEPASFAKGKTYRNYFDDDEITAIGRLIQAMASSELWTQLQRYFPFDDRLHHNATAVSL
jgi:hypothetical protein